MGYQKFLFSLSASLSIVFFAVIVSLAQNNPEKAPDPNSNSQERTLALRLIGTKDSVERNSLLASSGVLANSTLVAEIAKEGDRLEGGAARSAKIDVYNLALLVAERINDTALILKCLNDLGTTYLAEGKSAEAIDSFQRGIAIGKQLAPNEMTAKLLGGLGIAYSGNDNEKAIDFFQQSISVAEQSDAKPVMAVYLSRLGNIYTIKGDLVTAVALQRRALFINEQQKNAGGVAINLVNMGIVQISQGDYAGAQGSFERGLAYFDSVNQKDRAGITLYNLGNVFLEKGDFAQAMACYSRSLKIFEELGFSGGIEGVSTNIANLYIVQGNFELARTYLNRASLIADKTGKTIPQYALGSFGDSYAGEGNLERAIEYYERLLALKEKADNKDSIAETLINIGNAYLLTSNVEKARHNFARALELTTITGNHVWILRSLIGLARTALAKKDFRLALDNSTEAKAHYEKLIGSRDYWELYTTLGRAHLGLGQTQEAKADFARAIGIINDQRDRVAGGASERRGFFENKLVPYQLTADILISEGKTPAAFTYVELAKARALIESIGSKKTDISRSMTPDERIKERGLRTDLISIAGQLEKENRKANPSQRELLDIESKLVRKRLEYDDFQVQIYSAHPELRVLRGETAPIRLEEIESLIPNERTMIAEFFVTDEKTKLFAITRDAARKLSLQVFTIDVRKKDLGTRIEAYRSKLESGDLSFQGESRALYDLLLKPVQGLLTGKTNVILVPDASLWDLPFQTLRDSNQRYLVEHAALSYAPSLTALKEMIAVSKKRKAGAFELAAFGNPIVGKATSERIGQVFMGEKLGPLPDAERLVNELGKMYGTGRSRVFVGGEASEEAAKTESPKYRVVQFATHGMLNNASPMYSHLVLARDEKNTNEDGLLEAWELKDLGLKADIVILSACDTARGKISGGEGVIGMTWAAFIAGAPTTVASQWKVESSSTTEFMLEFHRQLLAGKRVSKAEALRRASLKLMRSTKYRRPLYWAPWVLVGDGS